MALGLPQSGGGERVPIVKYDARAGRLFRVDRAQNAAGQYDSVPHEVTPVFQAVFDLEHIELGWLSFPTNGAPDIQVVPYGQPLPPKPSPAHRVGFRVMMLLGKAAGGDVREMAANAAASIKGMDALHDAYLAGVKSNPGKLPVVKLGGTAPIVSTGKQQSSTNYEPLWSIVSWVDRPAPLSPESIQKLRNGGDPPLGAVSHDGTGAALNGARGPEHIAAPPPPPPPAGPPSIADDF
jgi:hypothetical protein